MKMEHPLLKFDPKGNILRIEFDDKRDGPCDVLLSCPFNDGHCNYTCAYIALTDKNGESMLGLACKLGAIPLGLLDFESLDFPKMEALRGGTELKRQFDAEKERRR